ncbi:hypothetical protein A9Q81_22385 [Gammaproteobacteria bacterium 42_54_T18]|nr:hypothetical protein A9Q81_22385 [Gammaproteobacteria bacterium 42_54_T18]
MSRTKKNSSIEEVTVQDLKKQESNFSWLCSSQSGCILLHDLNGDIIDANEQAQKYLGYDKWELIRLNIKDIQPSKKRGTDSSPIALDIYNESRVDITRAIFVRKGGPRFTADVKTSFIRFHNDDGYMTVIQRVFRNSNELENKFKKNEEKVGAKAGPDERTDFLTLMQNHLTNPLIEMLEAIKLLNDTDVDYEQKSLLKLTEYSGDYLMNNINDTLAILKMNCKQFKVNDNYFNLSGLLEEVIDTVTPAIDKKSIRFSNYIDAEIPEFVVGDESRLRMVLIKLINNAIKMTDKGSINLEVNITMDGRVRFEVMDTGEGIEEHEQKQLFSGNITSNYSVSRRYEEVAIGYTLAKEVVFEIGGEFGYSSKIGEGSLFWFSMDICDNKMNKGPDRYKFLTGRTIVYIDTEDKSRDEIQRQLTSWGANLEIFDYESEAINFFNDEKNNKLKVEFIILNAHKSDGIYAAIIRSIQNFLQRISNYNDCSFVVITPKLFSPGTARHFARIKHTHLNLPLTINAFGNKLARLICEEDPYESSSMGNASPIEIGKLKILEGRVLVVDDGRVTQKATAIMLSKHGLNVNCVSSGIDAISAVEKNHYDVILMDVVMPDMDGMETSRRIRKLENNQKHTPILAVTGVMKDDIWKGCVYAGMDDYMTKPIDTQQMVATIEYWMGTNEVSNPFNIGASREQESPSIKEEVSELISGIRQGDIVIEKIVQQMIIDTSHEITEEMVNLYLRETKVRISDLQSALEIQDFSHMIIEANTLVSSSKTFGAYWMQRLAMSFEECAKSKSKSECREMANSLDVVFNQTRSKMLSLVEQLR